MSIARRRLMAYAVILLGLAAAANLVKNIVRLNRAGGRLVEAEAKLRAAEQEQAELQLRLAAISNDFWQESQIRNVLKMARPEETVVGVPEEISKVVKGGEAV